ncbi:MULTISPECIES: hypothetical protein [Synechococcaceae]|uniref:hypothetical protein n=1 Tax=Synechococcaceae TaxID=1890426 RepID=UPI000B1D2C57|nr:MULTISPECIES: hypothetical protein [Synechococcaceae]MCT0244835.1 hypothetical protein [Synechococcus sp. CS-601]MCT4365130.1 hypothetical protein [Candidatus Regnicoccus frigidus MAG-AL1]TWB88719.1 hypothetical protein FB106_11582 [Synechococcus sp. Ace-Pa]MCT0202057.1 hypothetical protein [Synechococcus sp. CS-603]MCT4367426.1 hypothetical protein [Candidatus Regnicoccus frigidus MAG-AL2]
MGIKSKEPFLSGIALLLLSSALVACAGSSPSNTTPSAAEQKSPLLVPLDQAREAAKELEAKQLERQNAAVEAVQ